MLLSTLKGMSPPSGGHVEQFSILCEDRRFPQRTPELPAMPICRKLHVHTPAIIQCHDLIIDQRPCKRMYPVTRSATDRCCLVCHVCHSCSLVQYVSKVSILPQPASDTILRSFTLVRRLLRMVSHWPAWVTRINDSGCRAQTIQHSYRTCRPESNNTLAPGGFHGIFS